MFWIVDNGSDHRGKASIKRLEGRWPTLILLHLPVHASWLNQIEIYHSTIQRKILDPDNFASTAELARALNDFERRYNEIAEPFQWHFTRESSPTCSNASTGTSTTTARGSPSPHDHRP